MNEAMGLKWEGQDRALPGRLRMMRLKDRLFVIASLSFIALSLCFLALLLFELGTKGAPRINFAFFTSFPSRFPGQAGIYSAWVGSLCVLFVTAATAIPLGIAAGIYLEEYARKNRLSEIIELNIANLAGVPSILFGLLALGIFVYKLKLGTSVLTAGLTLGLLILPIVIVATQEAIRAVPHALREAAYALGATKWQCIKDHVLPSASGSILTGIIIALSRAIGETAPLVTIGALTFVAFLPPSPVSPDFPFLSLEWLHSPFTVMPIQMFNWTSRPQVEFHQNAAAAGLVLILLTLAMNSVAILLRSYLRNKWKQ